MANPPKLDPQRGSRGRGIVKLPAEGRRGDLPAWPLEGRQSAAERRVWVELWATPQAVMWERLGWLRVVARYARVLLEAEERDAAPMARAEARQLEDKLGLTPKAMRLLLWEVVADEVAERRETTAGVRKRIRAV